MKSKNIASILFMFVCYAGSYSCDAAESSLIPHDLKVEYKADPTIDESVPRFSWILQDGSRAQYQTAYQLIIATSTGLLEPGKADVWDSKKQKSDQMSQVEFQGEALLPTTTYFWKVRAWDREGKAGPWSQTARFQTGLLQAKNWQAQWIGYDLTHLGQGEVYHLPPAPYLRKEIEVSGAVKKASLYATALGVYDFMINGEKVGVDYLNPGWTNYHKRVNYQAFDVTESLKTGSNTLGTVLSYGWYSGYLGYALLVGLPQVRGFYGDVPKLLAQLEVEYEDGNKEYFVTDGSWKASAGPLLESDILQGESYDARKELTGWEKNGYTDSNWDEVTAFEFPDIDVHLHPGMPIRVIEELKPVDIKKRPEGYIFNLGQNFAGIVELKVKGKAGQKLVLTYGEMLHPDGRLMTENLRMARATDTYILKGDPEGETWQPRFTFHGFQYVQIAGLTADPDKEMLTGLVLSSDHKKTSTFSSGSEMINKLYKNINWTQLSNFLDVPTDCPQRDERLGWTGDAQVYVNSAMINRDVASFFTKWIGDLNDDQWETGAYPNFAPTPFIRPKYDFSPGWMEAGVICTYNMYRSYADTRIIEKYWSNMERFMDFYKRRAGDNYVLEEASFEDIVPKGGFGDWLSLGKKTPPDMLSTLYYGYCAQLMSEMAGAAGKKERATYYNDLFGKIKEGLFTHYGGPDATFKCDEKAYGNGKGYIDGELGFEGHTQTAYANALYMNYYTPEEELRAGEHLVTLIEENGGKVSAGFLGTKPMLPALSRMGYTSLAYDLFLSEEYPSWGFEIVNGASTIWERWNSYTHEEGFGGERNAGMNSFNHYAFGAVCEWMYEYAAGIKAATPAYREITIRPEVDRRLGHLSAEYQSISGPIRSSWSFEENGLAMQVSVPVNVNATIYVPAESLDAITEGEKPVEGVSALTFKAMEKGFAVFEAGSGDYAFFVKE